MTDTPLEANLRVVGTVFSDGGGKQVEAHLQMGDGFPPAILIRTGMDKSTMVVDLTVAGFADLGSTDATLKATAEFLKLICEAIQQTPAWEGTYGVN